MPRSKSELAELSKALVKVFRIWRDLRLNDYGRYPLNEADEGRMAIVWASFLDGVSDDGLRNLNEAATNIAHTMTEFPAVAHLRGELLRLEDRHLQTIAVATEPGRNGLPSIVHTIRIDRRISDDQRKALIREAQQALELAGVFANALPMPEREGSGKERLDALLEKTLPAMPEPSGRVLSREEAREVLKAQEEGRKSA